MKSKSGFTLVELLVVISVMAIITSMVVVAFATQQRHSRDGKRANDLVSLSDAFDRYYSANGSYPLTCGVSSLSQLACGGTTMSTVYSSGFQPVTITPTSTLAEIRADLPQLGNSFRNPRSNDADPPINHTIGSSISARSYFAFSPDLLPGQATALNGSVSFYSDTTNSTTFSCDFQLPPNLTKPHRYILGLFSEVDNAWKFFMSSQASDVNNITWTSSTNPELCTTSSTGDLKLLSSS